MNLKDEIKAELQKYINDVKSLNAQLQELEAQKSRILQVGTRIEGVIAYLRSKLTAEELAIIDSFNSQPAAPAAPAAPAEPAPAEATAA
jgi:hypothetical protein